VHIIHILIIRGDHFRFGSVFIKKSNQTEFFYFKKTETGSNRPVSVRFGFLGKKPVQTGLDRFFWFWLGFLSLARFFWFGSVFFPVFSVSVRFFGFLLIKPKPNRTGRFFQNFNRFNRFFFRFGFFGYFFFNFLSLIGFSVFFVHPYSLSFPGGSL